ncbi:unnamed protein product, partial [Mesorhabditis belari]|uniref:BED-type domain-containing protein n=1 Tax=Mesorhabditis belari TaxID=2138241 RepID=A0AAF3EEH3_9BILA
MRSSSKVWQYFEPNGEQVVCLKCREMNQQRGIYKKDPTGGTGHLKRHIRIEHPEIFVELTGENPSFSGSTTPYPQRPKRLTAGRKKHIILFGDERQTVTETLKFRLDLIKLVEKHPELWNRDSFGYQKADLMYQGWEDVGKTLSERFSIEITGVDCKKLFDSQRCYYRVHRKRLRTQTIVKWPYWEALQFLSPMYEKMENESVSNLGLPSSFPKIYEDLQSTSSFDYNKLKDEIIDVPTSNDYSNFPNDFMDVKVGKPLDLEQLLSFPSETSAGEIYEETSQANEHSQPTANHYWIKSSMRRNRRQKRTNFGMIKKKLLLEELKRSKLQTKLVRVRLERAMLLKEITCRELEKSGLNDGGNE